MKQSILSFCAALGLFCLSFAPAQAQSVVTVKLTKQTASVSHNASFTVAMAGERPFSLRQRVAEAISTAAEESGPCNLCLEFPKNRDERPV